MPLITEKIKNDIKETVAASLARVHPDVTSTAGYSAVSKEQFEKLAEAIADGIAVAIDAIKSDAIVSPGIAVSTSGGAGATTAPGKIL